MLAFSPFDVNNKVFVPQKALGESKSIPGPIVGGLVNKFGSRAVMMSGSVLASLSFFLSVWAPQLVHFLLLYGFCAGESKSEVALSVAFCWLSWYYTYIDRQCLHYVTYQVRGLGLAFVGVACYSLRMHTYIHDTYEHDRLSRGSF